MACIIIKDEILNIGDNENFLKGILKNVTDLIGLVPASFHYIFNAIDLVARAIDHKTEIPLVFFHVLLEISEAPFFARAVEGDDLDDHIRWLIRRLLSFVVEARSQESFEVYNEAAEIFIRENNSLMADKCYRQSLKINPRQKDIENKSDLILQGWLTEAKRWCPSLSEEQFSIRVSDISDEIRVRQIMRDTPDRQAVLELRRVLRISDRQELLELARARLLRRAEQSNQ